MVEYLQQAEVLRLLGAVDVCFKAFYIFDFNYPKQCAPAREYIQKVGHEMGGSESTPVKFCVQNTVRRLEDFSSAGYWHLIMPT